MSKRAIILAGGKGERLRPYTNHKPKPLVSLGNLSMLEIIIGQLAYYGFDHVTLATNHQGELIRDYIGNGHRWNICIDYSKEYNALGTIGPLSLLRDLPKHFLIMNCDILTDLDFHQFYEEHMASDALFSISAFSKKEEQAYGVIDLDERGFLRDFREKPVMHIHVSMGVYMARRDILDRIPHNEPFGFDQLVHRLLSEKKPPKIALHKGYWQDIGCPEDYELAKRAFTNRPNHFLPSQLKTKHGSSQTLIR